MLGLPVWEPSIGHGSFLTIQFGAPRMASGGYTEGEFHLWVFDALWQIREGTKIIAHSEEDRITMEAGARLLEGASLQSFLFDRERMTLSLRFDRHELEIPPSGEPEMEEWFLFLEDGSVITAGPGNALIHELAGS